VRWRLCRDAGRDAREDVRLTTDEWWDTVAGKRRERGGAGEGGNGSDGEGGEDGTRRRRRSCRIRQACALMCTGHKKDNIVSCCTSHRCLSNCACPVS